MQKYVIALYIRLSLEDYKYDSMSIENQHLVLNEFVSSMPESTDAVRKPLNLSTTDIAGQILSVPKSRN